VTVGEGSSGSFSTRARVEKDMAQLSPTITSLRAEGAERAPLASVSVFGVGVKRRARVSAKAQSAPPSTSHHPRPERFSSWRLKSVRRGRKRGSTFSNVPDRGHFDHSRRSGVMTSANHDGLGDGDHRHRSPLQCTGFALSSFLSARKSAATGTCARIQGIRNPLPRQTIPGVRP
jgi:hypothetical protein